MAKNDKIKTKRAKMKSVIFPTNQKALKIVNIYKSDVTLDKNWQKWHKSIIKPENVQETFEPVAWRI